MYVTCSLKLAWEPAAEGEPEGAAETLTRSTAWSPSRRIKLRASGGSTSLLRRTTEFETVTARNYRRNRAHSRGSGSVSVGRGVLSSNNWAFETLLGGELAQEGLRWNMFALPFIFSKPRLHSLLILGSTEAQPTANRRPQLSKHKTIP